MDRFEDYQKIICESYNADLHSSMDRFEGHCLTVALSQLINLHSSMDRFEVMKICEHFVQCLIYIPVWIDLKLTLRKSQKNA